MKFIYAIATMDTKGEELAYVAERCRGAGSRVRTVDVSTSAVAKGAPDVTRQEVAACHPDGPDAVLGKVERGEAINAMARALESYLLREHAAGAVAGVVSLGGSGGTALVSPALRALPIGLPKVLVSTVASGDTRPYVGSSDITLMYSVVDVAGLNQVSRRVLGNAAHAISGMVGVDETPDVNAKRTLGLTMFGVTTPCVTRVRERLEALGYDCLVFHATGTGGQAMEKLVESGLIQGVLDITTTEVADQVVGGVFAPGPQRFDAIVERNIPCVMSLGALDMVNFGAKNSVPEQFQNRKLHVHNAQVTLMRTTPQENRDFARWIATKINRSLGPLSILIPERGLSLLDVEGQPFHDFEADQALFEELEKCVDCTARRTIARLPHAINDAAFADALVNEFTRLARSSGLLPG